MSTALSIDIGGTQTKLARVGRDGVIRGRRALDTRSSRSVDAFMRHLLGATDAMRAEADAAGDRPLGIGIGAPSCNEFEGTIAGAANLVFQEAFPIREEVARHTGLPVYLLKDSSAAALGEHQYGGARGMRNVVVLTLGTGLGSGVLCEGRLVRGATGLASEFGHALVEPGGRVCGCGGRGCLETYVSATGIVRTAFALLAETQAPSPLRARAFEATTAEDLYRAARAGDGVAREAFQRTGTILGRKITDLIVLLEPEAIFLSGGLATAGELLLEPVREAVGQYLLPLMRGKVQIQLSELGAHDAALLGAAAPILHQQKEILS